MGGCVCKLRFSDFIKTVSETCRPTVLDSRASVSVSFQDLTSIFICFTFLLRDRTPAVDYGLKARAQGGNATSAGRYHIIFLLFLKYNLKFS